MKLEFPWKKVEVPQKQVIEQKSETKEEKIKSENREMKPIRACLVDSEEIDSQTRNTIKQIEKNGQFVDWDGNKVFLRKNNLRNAGESTYVISESNKKDKYSKRYCNCTGIAIVGEKKDSNKQISFMSHQDPYNFLSNNKTKFTQDLVEAIKEIKNKTKKGSVDAVVFGGKAGNGDEYERSIRFITNILSQEFDFEPTVMTGPNTRIYENSTKVYFDTQNRRLWIVRPAQKSEANENYVPNELDKKSRKW